MKTKALAAIVGCFLTLLFSANVQAQMDSVKTMAPVTVTKVTAQVSEAFQAKFKDAVDPIWSRLDKDYLVQFNTADQQNQALFRKNGFLLYHIAYGDEGNLPDDLRKLVKANYVEFNITHAIKVEEGGRTIWVVNLEDKERYVIVRCEDYMLDEVKNLKKANP